MKKYACIALGYSLCGSMGLYFLFQLYTMAVSHEVSRYPFHYLLYIQADIVMLGICVWLFYLNTELRKHPRPFVIKSLAIELAIVLAAFFPLYIVWSYALEPVRIWI